MLPAGNYDAVATPDSELGLYAQFGESKNGKQQVAINFEIITGEHAGRHITWFGYFVPAAATRTIEALRYCGFRGDDLSTAPTQKLNQRVQIVVEHDEYQGRKSAKVKWVNRGGNGGVKLAKPYDAKAMRDLAQQLKATVSIIPEEAGPAKQAPAGPVADLDDVMF